METFSLRVLIGSTPEATTFQAMLCLLIYNITLTIRHFVAAGAKVTPEEVSLDLLFDDVRRDLTGCLEVLGAEATTELFETTHIDDPMTLAEYLAAILKGIWTDEGLPGRRAQFGVQNSTRPAYGDPSENSKACGRNGKEPMMFNSLG